MHLKQVETFLTVAECGSFSRAGEKLFISSSAVAQQIGSLEEGKCADLFLVDSRRLELVGALFDPKSALGTVGLKGAVDFTIVNGQVIVEHGRLAKVDEEKLAYEANRQDRLYLGR